MSKRKFFTNKVAIVTGSNGGIGRTTAFALAELGASIVINGRNKEKLDKTLSEMTSMGYEVIAVQADVASAEDAAILIQKAIDRFGKLDILINNAGVIQRSQFMELKPEVFKKIIDVNILGSVYPSMYALPHLVKTKGHLIFISSFTGKHGLPTSSAYSAAKMALRGLAESLKFELSGTGVHTGIVYIGFTENDPDKTVLAADGSAVPVTKRPAYLDQSQETVARSILNNILKRKFSSTIFPVVGKISSFCLRYFPYLVHKIYVLFRKRMENV
ncbi:MAG: SDR family oxidoreductase [Bacteroidota bacterium]